MFKQAFSNFRNLFKDRKQTTSTNPIAPVTDDYSKPRNRIGTVTQGSRYRARKRALRRSRQEMAFESRRRNRRYA